MSDDDGFLLLEKRYKAVCQELHDVTAKRHELQSKLDRCRNALGEAWELLIESVDSATPTDDIDKAHTLEVDIVRAALLRQRIEDLFPEDFK